MFKINGKEWDVRIVDASHPFLNGALGCCDNNYKIIYLSNNVTEHKLYKVLCHEIAHAAMFSYGVTLDIQEEEVVADLIATYGYEIVTIANKVYEKIGVSK